jgi:hypothetical protein
MKKNSPTINEVENFWDSRPCNIKHSNAEIGTIEYFNEVERRKYFVEPHIVDFANFDNWSEKMVLEVDDKLRNIHETFDKQYSELLNNINYSDNEITNEECITIDDEDKRIHGHELQETDINQNENITINLKEIIENELNEN